MNRPFVFGPLAEVLEVLDLASRPSRGVSPGRNRGRRLASTETPHATAEREQARIGVVGSPPMLSLQDATGLSDETSRAASSSEGHP